MRICCMLSLAVCSTVAMAQQYGRATGTTSSGSWSPVGAATLHEAVDETTSNDFTDYMEASSSSTAILTVSSLTDPGIHTGHILSYAYNCVNNGTQVQVELYDGATLIASTGLRVRRNTFAVFDYTLTEAEAALISDYSNLTFHVSSSTTSSAVRCSWIQLQVPAAVVANPPTLSTPTVTGVDTTQATLGATIDSDGGAAITARGTVWDTTTAPTGNVLAEGGTATGAFSHLRTGLPSATEIFFRGYATNSEGTAYSPELTFWTEPTAASSVTFSGVTDTGMTINWSAGNGGGALVLVKSGSAVDGLPTDGTTYTASTTFGSGTQIGAGNYVVFVASGTSVGIIGLTASTTYHVAVFEYAGSGTGISGINYQQDGAATGSQATSGGAATTPTLSSPTVASIELAQATLGATIDSDGGAAITARGTVWGTSTGPTGNVLAEGGTALGAFSHTRTALPSGTQIFFRGYADNSEGRAYSPELSFWTEPTKAANITFSGVTENTMTINWSAGGGDGALVLVKEAGAVSASPTDGTIYTASTIFGSGSQIGAGNYVVFATSGTSVSITGLTADTTYHVAVFEYAGSGTGISGINYQQDVPPTGSQITDAGAAVPTLSSPTVAAIDLTTATLGATLDTDGGDTILERGTVWGTTAAPTGNAQAEGGTALGAFTQGRTGLPSGTRVFFRGYADNSSGRGYSPDGSFYTEPTQASAVTFSSIQATSLTINWTAGGGDGAIVLMREAGAVTGSPTDGTEHAFSQTFGSGALISPDNYVVYRGPANSATVSGLTAETVYHVAVFEYAGSGTGISGINYQQDSPAVGNDTTAAPAEGHNNSYGIQCDQCHALHSPFGGTGVVARGADQLTVCTQCHSASGVASAKIDIGLHEVDGGATIIDCGSCHEIHNGYDFNTTDTHSGGVTAPNISRIRSDVAKYVPAAIEPAIFQQRPAHFAFDTANPPYSGICQVCHTSTTMHTNTTTAANNSHEVGGECMDCHAHDGGFAVSGGGCSSCHSSVKDAGDGPPTRRAIFGEFGLTSHHVEAGTATDDDCTVCHGEVYGTATHANNQVDLKNPDTGALISFTSFTRNRSTDTLESWVTNVQNDFCLKCHDGDGATATNFSGNALRPFTVGTRDVPDVFTSADPANATHHAIRAAGSNPYTVPSSSNGSNITMVTPWNQDANHDMISCFDCHSTSGHGAANQRMLIDPMDLDTMEAATAATDLPTGMGGTVETFCTRCHAASVYVSAADSEAAGSIFEYHGQSQQQHSAAGGNELGCFGCHAGLVNLGVVTTNNGAARGNIHGRNFVWPSDTFSNGTTTQMFMLGGWLGGWKAYIDSKGNPVGDCTGGDCNHTGSSSRSAQGYTR